MILIAVVILSFMLFFQFAINTGVLVIAKISLQNAADAAAYAGAATQARQMNSMSFLNYDMREQYKKFLFRYIFTASAGTPNFPMRFTQGMGYFDFPKNDYRNGVSRTMAPRPMNVPVVCIPFTTANDDSCLQVNLRNTSYDIKASFGGSLSPVTQEVIHSIETIQGAQQNLCGGKGMINQAVLFSWLFKGDSDTASIQNLFKIILQKQPNMTDAQRASLIAKIDSPAILGGLGLFPRNLINLMRIETLASTLNEPAAKEVGFDQVKTWEGTDTADTHERTIQAFHSALVNLNTEVMSTSSVTMSELQADRQIAIDPVKINFNVYVQMLKPGAQNSSGNPTFCDATFYPFPVLNAPVGVKRVSTTSVHYAVKLKAKANLLFLPMKDGIELEAVASAKPFGSRLGPSDLSHDQLVETDLKPPADLLDTSNGPPCTGPTACNLPNLRLSGAATFYSAEFIKQLAGVAVSNNNTYTPEGIKKALDHATAPNPFEVGRYNILPPAPPDASSRAFGFIPYADNPNATIYRFYAPLFSANQGDPAQRVSAFLNDMFPITQVSNNAFGINMQDVRRDLEPTIINYLTTRLKNGAGDNAESTTFAAIQLPMLPNQVPNKQFWLTTANEVMTSWGPDHIRVDPSAPHFAPRFGYSVKFVTMQNLKQEGMPSTDDDSDKVSH